MLTSLGEKCHNLTLVLKNFNLIICSNVGTEATIFIIILYKFLHLRALGKTDMLVSTEVP